MSLATFDIDGSHRSGRTIIFAGTATEALTLVNRRFALHHQDGRRGAMTGAGTTTDAVLHQHHSMANTDGGFLFFIYMLDGSRGAHFTAASTGRAAIAFVKSHVRLHERRELGGGAQYLLRTLADTQLAGRAAALEILQRNGSCGLQRYVALRHLFVFNGSETTVELLFLSLKGCSCSHSGSDSQEFATRRVVKGIRVLNGLNAFPVNLYRSLLAVAKAIEAHHTTAAIDTLVLEVDAVGFAALLTLAASHAFLAVDADTEEGILTDESQQSSHGAKSVAPKTAIEETHHADTTKRGDGNPVYQSRAVDIGHHTGIGAVRCHKSRNTIKTQHHQDNEECQHRIAHPILGLAIAVGALLTKDNLMKPDEDVLEDAHGADHRAVEATDEEGHQQDSQNDHNIECQDGWQELYLGHPS